MAILTDINAEPCTGLVRDGAALAKCGSTTVAYKVGGRTASRACSNAKRCQSISNIDVTICHAKTRWTLEAIRAWWVKVYG